jgi:hypothetical protein
MVSDVHGAFPFLHWLWDATEVVRRSSTSKERPWLKGKTKTASKTR